MPSRIKKRRRPKRLPSQISDMSFWWYLCTYLLFDIIYTMILVPYETLVPEAVTKDTGYAQQDKKAAAAKAFAQPGRTKVIGQEADGLPDR
jgi:Na+/melibiose symporter-like transporter